MSSLITYYFEALNFNGICKSVALTLCPLIGQSEGIEPVCYSRNVELSGNIIFQPCNKYTQRDTHTQCSVQLTISYSYINY